MPLVDDLQDDIPESEISRRQALAGLGGGALAVAGLGGLITGIRFMRPNVLFEPATKFPVGSPDELKVGAVLSLPARKVFVVRSEEGCYAMSSVCTHLGCMVKHAAAKSAPEPFFCPCHGSRFSLTGEVLGGPAPRPLDRLELELTGGQLVVDLSRKVPFGTVTEI